MPDMSQDATGLFFWSIDMGKATALTPGQIKFIDCYKGNATEAAREAGYKQPKVAGSRLLTNVAICAAIKAREGKEVKATIASRQERQEFWTSVMQDTGEDMKNRLKAAELLGKSNADFTENVNLKHDLGATLKAMSDEEVQTRLRNLVASGAVKLPVLGS